MNMDPVFARLQAEVIKPGLCTHCGTCVGLSSGGLAFKQSRHGPLPEPVPNIRLSLPQVAYDACPGKGLHYPSLNNFVFHRQPTSWLLGNYVGIFLAHATDDGVRRNAASGGVLTQTALYLLEQDRIRAAVLLQQGRPRPWQASPILATTRDEILSAAQSVYIPSPMNTILPGLDAVQGPVAYIGCPDQVGSLRRMQQVDAQAVRNIAYVFGPYVGTTIYLGAIESFLASNGVDGLDQISWLRYREGEWPGELQIRTRSGRLLRAEKFYYNYLIPFFITKSTLLSVDFTNELTDFSVGDAWHPSLEKAGGGFSVVVARTAKGHDLLKEMQGKGLLHLEPITEQDALAMHAHMLDFKKRGSFLRIQRRVQCGRPAPVFGYAPVRIHRSRKWVETIISGIFLLGSTRVARWFVSHIPLVLLGPLFNALRKAWKQISKPTKRRGLGQVEFQIDENQPKSGG